MTSPDLTAGPLFVLVVLCTSIIWMFLMIALVFRAPILGTCICSLGYVVYLYLTTDGQWRWHDAQEFENRFWTIMAVFFATSVLYASDSPLSSLGWASPGVGLCIVLGFALLVQFYDRAHHRATISRQPKLKYAPSHLLKYKATAEEKARLVSLCVEQIDRMYIPSTINNMWNLHRVKTQELKIYRILAGASKEELNYIINHVKLALLFYKVKDHNTTSAGSSHTGGSAGTGSSTRSSAGIGSSSAGIGSSSAGSSSSTGGTSAGSTNNRNNRSLTNSTTTPNMLGEKKGSSSSSSFSTQSNSNLEEQHRTMIVDLLCNIRFPDLSIRSRAFILDALMVMKLSAHAKSEVWVQRLICRTYGDDLSKLKSCTDAKADIHSMHKLVFSDLRNASIQQSVLAHIKQQASIQAAHVSLGTRYARVVRQQASWRKVLSDVDDTLYSSGGQYPAGVDTRYPRHTLYPGVLRFYLELDLGVNGPDVSSCSMLSPQEDRMMGNLAFLSARPHVYKDVSEKKSYAKFLKLYEEHKMHTLPTLLAGSLESGRAFMMQGDLEPMAKKKFTNFAEYYQLYPEFSHIFIGDNGQADVRAADLIYACSKKKKDQKNEEEDGDGDGDGQKEESCELEAGYFHLVQPLEETYGYNHEMPNQEEVWRQNNLFFFHTYVGAAVQAFHSRHIRLTGLRRVCLAAIADFESIPEEEWQSCPPPKSKSSVVKSSSSLIEPPTNLGTSSESASSQEDTIEPLNLNQLQGSSSSLEPSSKSNRSRGRSSSPVLPPAKPLTLVARAASMKKSARDVARDELNRDLQIANEVIRRSYDDDDDGKGRSVRKKGARVEKVEPCPYIPQPQKFPLESVVEWIDTHPSTRVVVPIVPRGKEVEEPPVVLTAPPPIQGIVRHFRPSDGIYRVEWWLSSLDQIMGYVHEDSIELSRIPLDTRPARRGGGGENHEEEAQMIPSSSSSTVLSYIQQFGFVSSLSPRLSLQQYRSSSALEEEKKLNLEEEFCLEIGQEVVTSFGSGTITDIRRNSDVVTITLSPPSSTTTVHEHQEKVVHHPLVFYTSSLYLADQHAKKKINASIMPPFSSSSSSAATAKEGRGDTKSPLLSGMRSSLGFLARPFSFLGGPAEEGEEDGDNVKKQLSVDDEKLETGTKVWLSPPWNRLGRIVSLHQSQGFSDDDIYAVQVDLLSSSTVDEGGPRGGPSSLEEEGQEGAKQNFMSGYFHRSQFQVVDVVA